jgi:hypothetical protein
VNHDSSVNVVDIQTMVNEARSVAAPTDDLNGDGAVDSADTLYPLVAALGQGCFSTAGPHTFAIASRHVSVENTTPVAANPPLYVQNGAPFSLENTVSPVPTGLQNYSLNGSPVSVENALSPVPTGAQTHEQLGLEFSLYNGLQGSSLTAERSGPSGRYGMPLDPKLVALILARGAANANGKQFCVDTDGDGICDSDELLLGTSPFLADSDGDGYPDGLELALGSDPLDPKSIPNVSGVSYAIATPFSFFNRISLAIVQPQK